MSRRVVARRRILRGGLGLVGLGLLTGCGAVQNPGRQTSVTPRRVGYLEAGTALPSFETFRQGMGEFGWVQDQNVVLVYRNAEGRLERLPALATELVDAGVEVLVASNSPSYQAASRATSTLPIVVAGGDVVASGLVTNIAHPEGNITGVTTNSIQVVGKWVELLKETVPTISQVAVVGDLAGPSTNPGTEALVQELERAARVIQVRLRRYDLRSLDQLTAALATAKADGADGLVLVSGGTVGGGANPRIGGEVLKSRLPAIAEVRDFAVSGGLLAHGTNGLGLVKRSASFVDKILKGAKPGDLPIELPTEFNIVVNLKAAEALGITVPQSVVTRATELIQ